MYEFWLYWLAVSMLGVLGYALNEIRLRRKGPRFITISVTRRDGTKRSIRINAGKDTEVQQLIDAVRRKKAT